MNNKPKILWILQENQVTPHIADFLTRLKSGISKLEVMFLAPEPDREALTSLDPLNLKFFRILKVDRGNTSENFRLKKNQIGNLKFSNELDVWRTLLLDDLGAGKIGETRIHMDSLTNIRGIILQIPTPLGSRTEEEFIFDAWVKWAHANQVFIAGYELLPLYTRWKLLPSVLDGIITTSGLSFHHLSAQCRDIKGKIWRLPKYEANVFTLGIGDLWQKGLDVPYHFKIKYHIPRDKTVLYMTHNVAMGYEYRRLIEEIDVFGSHIHLMFSIGKDQVRGTHTHRELIEITCGKSLKKFHSYSFHDLAAPWEMVMADAVVGCSHNYATMIAQANGIQSIVMDETVPEAATDYLKIISSYDALRRLVGETLSDHESITDLTGILYEIANREHPKLCESFKDLP